MQLGETLGALVWLLIGLVPFIGWIVLLDFFVLDSEYDNAYGPYPKD